MFHEEWFNESCQNKLAQLAKEVIALEGSYIEVGSWEGRSTIALANAIYPQYVNAVDWWQGSIADGYEPKERDVFKDFTENVNALTQGNVLPYKMRWEEFAKGWTSPIKFIFIDAEHTYQAVYDNIQWAKTLLVPKGIICGDDLGHPPVYNAVRDALGPMEMEFIWYWRNNG